MVMIREAVIDERDHMASLKVGYLLSTRDQAVRGDHDVEHLVEQTRRAEALGFDSVWAGDSPLTRPRADPLLLLSAVAVATRRITLGTAVPLPALRHPILPAHQLATLDRLAGGRLIVGMGGGFPSPGTEAQFTAIGVAFERRISRLEESIEALRLLWSGQEVSFTGRHFDFHGVTLAPAPAHPAGPPIWLAGGGAAARGRPRRRLAALPAPGPDLRPRAGGHPAERGSGGHSRPVRDPVPG